MPGLNRRGPGNENPMTGGGRGRGCCGFKNNKTQSIIKRSLGNLND